MGENQCLLNTLVSMSSSSPSYPARLNVGQIKRACVPYSSPFEMDFWVAKTFFSASDISFWA